MIYLGEFTSRLGNYIGVKFNTKEKPVTRTVGFGKSHIGAMLKVVDGKVDVSTPYSVPLWSCTAMRVFAGGSYKLLAPIDGNAGSYQWLLTDVQGKVLSQEMGALRKDMNLSKPLNVTRDGYLCLNIIGYRTWKLEYTQQDYTEVVFSTDPVTISQNSEDIYSPLKLKSATVRLVTPSLFLGLFGESSQSVTCEIYDHTNQSTLFRGYITPCVYSQSYSTPCDTLEVEAVSPISTLAYKEYKTDKRGVKSWYDVILKCFKATGFDYSVNLPDHVKTYVANNGNVYPRDIYDSLYIHEGNFFDDDNEETPWNYKEVLTEFCKTFGLSLTEENGKEARFVDFDSLKYNAVSYRIMNTNQPSEFYGQTMLTQTETFGLGDYTSSDVAISSSPVYSEIQLSSNFYPSKESGLNLLDDKNLVSLHPQLNYLTFTTSDTSLFKPERDGTIKPRVNLYQFYTSKLLVHNFYFSKFAQDGTLDTTPRTLDPSNVWGTNLLTCKDEAAAKTAIDNFLRSHFGAVVVKHLSYKEGSKPEKYKWETYLFVSYGLGFTEFPKGYDANLSAKLGRYFINYIGSQNPSSALPILTTKTDYLLPPRLRTFGLYSLLDCATYFTKGSYNTLEDNYEEEPKKSGSLSKLLTIRTRGTGPLPWDNIAEAEYELPTSDISEVRSLYRWGRARNNAVLNLNVIDTDGFLTEIPLGVHGRKKLEFYAPEPRWTENQFCPHFCYLKDFDLSFTRAYPKEVALTGKENKSDALYIEKTNSDQEKLELTLKINTQLPNKPLSYSCLLSKSLDYGFEYVDTLGNILSGKSGKAEELLLSKYLEHYKKMRVVLECSVSKVIPSTTVVEVKSLGKKFIVDSYSFEAGDDINRIKLIEL